jgi:hypothetical protein
VVLDFATKDLKAVDPEEGQKVQAVGNLEEDMEHMDGLVQYRMGLHLQWRMDRRRDLLSHAHCVTAAHSLGRVRHTGHLVRWLQS